MELEEAIKELESLSPSETAIETVLQGLKDSVPKNIIREEINKRQFELQQEYKEFKDDTRLNTLQELYYWKED